MYVWCAGHGHGEACNTWPHHQGRPGGVQDVGHCVQRTGQCGPVLPVQLQVGLVNPSGGLWRGGAGMLVCAWDSALGVAEQWCACRGQHLICITICARTCHHLHMSPHPPTQPPAHLLHGPSQVSSLVQGCVSWVLWFCPYCQPLAGRTSCTRRVMIPEAKAAGRTVRPAGLVANKAMPHLGRLLCC